MDRINIGGGLGQVEFRECQNLPYGKNISPEDRGIAYKRCVKSAMLYGNEERCLGQNEMKIMQELNELW